MAVSPLHVVLNVHFQISRCWLSPSFLFSASNHDFFAYPFSSSAYSSFFPPSPHYLPPTSNASAYSSSSSFSSSYSSSAYPSSSSALSISFFLLLPILLLLILRLPLHLISLIFPSSPPTPPPHLHTPPHFSLLSSLFSSYSFSAYPSSAHSTFFPPSPRQLSCLSRCSCCLLGLTPSRIPSRPYSTTGGRLCLVPYTHCARSSQLEVAVFLFD